MHQYKKRMEHNNKCNVNTAMRIVHQEHSPLKHFGTMLVRQAGSITGHGRWNEDLFPLRHSIADLRIAKESLHLNMDMYPATSTSNPRWRFWGKALAPPTGMGTFLRQVGHWRLFWGPTFSISLWRHWQQKECRHGSILGSLKGPKQSDRSHDVEGNP